MVSLFPGLGYAAAYKVRSLVPLWAMERFEADVPNNDTDPPESLQIRRPTIRARLPLHKPWRKVRPHIRQGQWQGNDVRLLRQVSRHSCLPHQQSQATMLTWHPNTSLIGVGEVILLPLDVLKIKRQTNPEAFRGRGILTLIVDEGLGLYRGWQWTMARNFPGSFALFGGSAATKQYFYKLPDYNAATWSQNFVASIAGSSASIIVSAPLDVIKTRIQNRNFEVKESGMRIVANMAKTEGMTSFFKGLTPKLLMTGPKLTFSFWLAQTLIPLFSQYV